MTTIKRFKKVSLLEHFARKIPNAESIFVDWGRDSLLVQFDGIHSKEFKISEILDAYIRQGKERGFTVEFI